MRKETMKFTFLKCLLVGILTFCLCSGMTYAAQREKPNDTDKDTGKTVTVTGCLEKGDQPGEYSMKGDDGKQYGLRSKNVKMDKDLNHKVTVTGKTMPSDKEKQEQTQLEVTNMKMVSTTCQ
jgi:hypothetical protein